MGAEGSSYLGKDVIPSLDRMRKRECEAMHLAFFMSIMCVLCRFGGWKKVEKGKNTGDLGESGERRN